MSKIVLFLLLILLSGCSFNSFLLKGEIDKVTVVKYTAYMKHHRAYFSRDQLKVIKNGKKYLYLHNEKNNDLAILLHRNNDYILYNLSQPKSKVFTLKANRGEKYTSALKKFKHMGYKTLSSPASKGYIVSESHKRYKGVRTLLIEVKEYTDLQKIYKNSIKTYDASKIKNIKTQLPKSLIFNYYIRYKKQATTHKQLTQLQIIAKKLQIKGPSLASQNIDTTKKEVKEDPDKKEYAWYEFSEDEENKVFYQEPSEKPYSYYLENAPLNELCTYISKNTTKDSLTYSQYSALKQREALLQEEKFLSEGSLEELITAYKVNKSPKYKERIMLLMKEKQK